MPPSDASGGTLVTRLRELRGAIPEGADLPVAPGLAHGSMFTVLYAPRGEDKQTPHEQDEIYMVAKGRATLVTDDGRFPLTEGDLAFVAANDGHRFEDISDDFLTWAIFWGPQGGE